MLQAFAGLYVYLYILYKLKEAWNDGTIGIQLSPSELIEKLIALIPPRRSPLVRYGEPLYARGF